MPATSFQSRRAVFRGLIEREQAVVPVSVWDAVSARLAASMGFEVGLFAGSVASHVVLGAPDLVLLTLTEFVEQTRRITRATDLPLIVDADHGYGNARNVQRTVQELEAAGVAALTIEDTVLPRSYGTHGAELISREEFRDKLRAAVAARVDASLVIVGRTGALQSVGLEEAVARAAIATEVGVDAVFVLGTTAKEQVEAVHAATRLPLVLNTLAAPADELAKLGVRLVFQGHAPYFVALRALHEAYTALRDGVALKDRVAGPDLQAQALDAATYATLTRDYLGASSD